MTDRAVRMGAGCLLLGAVVVGALLVSPETTLATLATLEGDPLAFTLVAAGLYAIRPLFLWPTTPLAVVVGYGLGVTVGLPLALVGVLVTVTPVFLAVQWLVPPDDGGGLVRRTARRYFETTGPVRGVTAARLAPIPSDVTTAAAAVSGVRYRQLLLGTAIGELPWLVAAVIVGATAQTVAADGLGAVGLSVAVACSLAALVLLTGPALRWWGLEAPLDQKKGSEQS